MSFTKTETTSGAQTQLMDRPFEHVTDFFLSVPDQNLQLSLPEFLTIGRDRSNSLKINDPCVSSRHSRIERHGAKFILRDLRSRNGTHLNGSLVQEAILQHGDIITLGKTDILIQSKTMTYPKSQLQSKNTKWAQQLNFLPSISQSSFPVLLQGPTGSGKEVLAQEIHKLSQRSQKKLVTLNCSAFTSTLFESQLFGHLEGSFTGAHKDRNGAFQEAHEGTLFLDEIGDLPLDLQPKLLRALENSEIIPVGSDKPLHVDVRIIAATHKDLNQMVNDGLFREDLLYRLQTFILRPPSLTERIEDFDSLIFGFAKEFRVRFSHNCIQELKTKRWPGNIRQLKQMVQRASVLFQGQSINPEDIPLILNEPEKVEPTKGLEDLIQSQNKGTLGGGSLIKQFEKEMILERLAANKGNQRQTARELGIAKSTLNDRIKAYKKELHL